MNAITGLADDPAACSIAAGGEPREYTLRRSGHKAVRFTGYQMVEAQGGGDAGKMWYDLAIYRTESAGVVVELTARRRMLDEQDVCRVEVFDNLADASAWLETYPCANDVPIPASLSDTDGPLACSVLQAVNLRQMITRITDDYHSLLSDVFEVLDLTDRTGAIG